MKFEYIFKTEPDISSIKAEGVDIKSTPVNDKVYFVTAFIDGNSEKAARKLSDIKKQIEDLKPDQCVVDESSEYFNRVLYPLTNRFERKLRQYLYTAKFLLDINDADKIVNLEKLDLGKID